MSRGHRCASILGMLGADRICTVLWWSVFVVPLGTIHRACSELTGSVVVRWCFFSCFSFGCIFVCFLHVLCVFVAMFLCWFCGGLLVFLWCGCAFVFVVAVWWFVLRWWCFCGGVVVF